MRDPEVLFEALLTPYRSLPPAGFLALMAFLIGLSVAIGVGFSLAGAWPVLGFLGIDIILVFVAFRISYDAGLQSERIRLTSDTLEVEFSGRANPPTHFVLQPYWAKIDVETVNAKTERMIIRSHGRALEIGSFLGRIEKRAFAEALTDALRKWRDAVPTG
jgi:uncharacterized membrane protein